MWGESIECEQDVWDVFTAYLTGEPNRNGVKVISEFNIDPVFLAHKVKFKSFIMFITSFSGLSREPFFTCFVL